VRSATRFTLAAFLAPLLACGTDPGGDSTSGSGGSTGPAPSTGEAPTTAGAASTAATTSEATSGGTTGEAVFPDACDEPIAPVARTDARLGVDAGGRLRDAHGRDVQLRGVNTGGRSKWAPFAPFPVDPEADLATWQAAAERFFARLVPWGVNVVRMPFSWEALEPSEGTYDPRYLDRYAAMVDAAWARGIAVVVDFHQDIYASLFCGDGFPPWTLPGDPGPGRHDCEDWGLKYLSDPDVRGAFDRFWADEGAIQAKFFAMWDAMIDRVGEHPGVVGLEILNEPGWGSMDDTETWKHDVLLPFWDAAVLRLRERAGDEPLILYNNTGFDALFYAPVVHVRPAGDNIMYAPHLYDGNLINGLPWSGDEPGPHVAEVAGFAAEAGVAVLLGEFGYGDGADGGAEWLTRTYAALDQHRLSSTQWECSQSAELWNFEDLSMLAADGSERAVVDVFVRPYLRAVAGDEPSFAWDPQTGTATARWTGDGGVSEVALPPRRFPAGPTAMTLTTVEGPAGACLTYDRERGEVRVSAPDGAKVELTIEG
jgi:endoglycosylceramidase